MSPAGRHPLAGEAKSEPLITLLTDSERALLDAAGALAGKPTSTWARDELLRLAKEATAQEPATKKRAEPVKKPKA
jgi:hypothetical protein